MTYNRKKYARGGFFGKAKDVGLIAADNLLSTIGMRNVIDDDMYNSSKFSNASKTAEEIGKWGSRVVLTAINPAMGALHTGVSSAIESGMPEDKTRERLAQQSQMNANSSNPYEAMSATSSGQIRSDQEMANKVAKGTEIVGQVASTAVGGFGGGASGVGGSSSIYNGANNVNKFANALKKAKKVTDTAGSFNDAFGEDADNMGKIIDGASRAMDTYNSISNIFSDGGQMNQNPTDMSGDMMEYQGAKHEQGGIPVDENGNPTMDPNAPNEVEGGETKVDDYIFSDRLKVPGSKETFADQSKEIEKRYGGQDDQISNNSRKMELERLMKSQEDVKKAKEEKEMIKGSRNKFGNGGDLSREEQIKQNRAQVLKEKLKNKEISLEEYRSGMTDLGYDDYQEGSGVKTTEVSDEEFEAMQRRNKNQSPISNGVNTMNALYEDMENDNLIDQKEYDDVGYENLESGTRKEKRKNKQEERKDRKWERRNQKWDSRRERWKDAESDNTIDKVDAINEDIEDNTIDPMEALYEDMEHQNMLDMLKDSDNDIYDPMDDLYEDMENENMLDMLKDSENDLQQAMATNDGFTKRDMDRYLAAIKPKYKFDDKASPLGMISGAIGDLHNLVQPKDDPNYYGRLNPNYVDYSEQREQARRDVARSSAIARENSRNVAGSGLASSVASNALLNQNLTSTLANSYMTEQNTNRQLDNTYDQLNQRTLISEDIANRQDEAAYRSAHNTGLHGAGSKVAGYGRDVQSQKADNLLNNSSLSILDQAFEYFSSGFDGSKFNFGTK